MNKPFVSITAYDSDGNEMTSTIEIETSTNAAAIELWQYLRMQAERWADKFGQDKGNLWSMNNNV